MRIALIHTQYLQKGGMESYLTDLIRGFSDAGDQVVVVTGRVDPEAATQDRCEVVCADVSAYPKKLRSYFFARKVRRTLSDRSFDLSISLTRTWGQQVTICGGTHRGYLAHMGKWTGPLDRLEIRQEQTGYDHSETVVAHSAPLRNELESLYRLPEAKVTVIHPPVDGDRFSRKPGRHDESGREKYGVRSDRVCLLFCSTGHKRKGLKPLLKAMQLLPPTGYELVIAGSPARGADRLPQVRHLGFVRQMEELYSAVDFTVVPSLYEPFGLVVTESLMCGTPVLVSKNVGALDIIGSSEGLVFDDLRPRTIADTIVRASETKFNIEDDLARKRGLTLARHIEKLKAAVGRT